MKRVGWILSTAILFAAALFALLVVLLPRETLRTRIGEQIAAWTGRDVSLSGEPEVDFFPRLTVTLNDVQVGGPAEMRDAGVISMDRLTGTIRILPLIIGRVEIGSFTMVRPVIRLVRDADGTRNWAFDSGAAALQLAFAGDVPLGNFLLENGAVVYENRVTGETERLDSVNLSVTWPSVRQPLVITGSGIWRGEEVGISVDAEAPFAFLNGSATPVEARVESAPIALTFSGTADDYPGSTLAGSLEMSTPSLRRFAAWLGSPIGPGSTLGPASLVGAATFRDMVLSMESAELTLDGNSASGALEVAAAQRPEVSGTLAFDTLDLTPYFAGLAQAFRTAENWRDIRVDTDWFRDLGTDIRLSAGTVALGNVRADNAAATLSLRDSRLEIGLARAVLNGGSLTGDLAIVDAAGRSDAIFEGRFRATDLDLADSAPLFGLPSGVVGIASAAVDAAAAGASIGMLMESLAGSAQLDIRDGAVPLFGLAGLAEAAGEAPALAADATTITPIAALSASMSLANGNAIIERSSIVAGTFTADAVGRVGLADGALTLDGTLWPGGSAGAGSGEAQPFLIEGTLRRPTARRQALAN